MSSDISYDTLMSNVMVPLPKPSTERMQAEQCSMKNNPTTVCPMPSAHLLHDEKTPVHALTSRPRKVMIQHGTRASSCTVPVML